MDNRTPRSHFFACGAAEGETVPNSTDNARLQAGIGSINLIETGNVIPPWCRIDEPLPLPEGAIIPALYTEFTSNVPGEVISAGVAIAYPTDDSRPAVAMKYATCGHKEDIEAIVRRMAEEGLRQRGLNLKEIHSVAVQHRVEQRGAVCAAVVLWSAD